MSNIIINTRSKRNISLYKWETKDAKANLVIVHGASEHINRYQEFAQFLCENGINVYGYNHIGHGDDRLDNKGIYFGDNNGFEILVNDLEDVCHYVINHSEYPLIVFGHSMGSLVVRALAMNTKLNIQGFILCGSLHPNKIIVNSGLSFAKFQTKLSGKRAISKSLNKLAFGEFGKRISYSKDNIKKYQEDNNCGIYFCNQAIVDLLTLIKSIISEDNIKKMQDKDYYIISGADDPFSDKTKQIKKYIDTLSRYNINYDYKFYENMMHEILNESNKDVVYNDIVVFINKCINKLDK